MNEDYQQPRPFVMQPSYVKAIAKLPSEYRGEAYCVVNEYGCFGVLPSDGTHWAISALFEAIRPSIDSSIQNYEKASRGGAPRGNSNNPYGRGARKEPTSNQPKPTQEPTSNQPELTQEPTSNQPEPTQEPTSNQPELTQEPTLTNLNQPNQPNIDIDKDKDKDKNISRSREITRERARDVFLNDFFAGDRREAVRRQAERLGTTFEHYVSLVAQVLDDWEVNGPVPPPDNELRSKMLNTVRKKFRAQESERQRQGGGRTPVAGRQQYEQRRESARLERNAVYDREHLSGEALAAKLKKWQLPDTSQSDPDAALEEALADARALG